MKNYIFGALCILVSANSMASSPLTKCGAYYVDRVGKEIFSIGPKGEKRTLGGFARDPYKQVIPVYPGYTEESFMLTSGIAFSIRTDRDGVTHSVLSEPMMAYETGSCEDLTPSVD